MGGSPYTWSDLGRDAKPDPKADLPKVSAWEKRVEMQRQREQLHYDRKQQEYARQHQAELQIFMSFDMDKPRQQLAKELPQELERLLIAVKFPQLPVERRAKVLEVLMHKDFSFRATMKDAHEARDGAIRDAVLNDPRLFDLLSNRADERWDIPGPDLYPATAVLETIVPLSRERDARRQFQRQLTTWPPESLGRMLYHTDDAAENRKYFEEERGKYLRETLAAEYGKMTDDQKKAFKEGYVKAQSVQPAFPKDVTDLRKTSTDPK